MNEDIKDWHSADIIAALKKKVISISALSRHYGLASSTLANALVRPWTKGEMLIADALGITPQKIWPSRYINKSRRLRITSAMINKKTVKNKR